MNEVKHQNNCINKSQENNNSCLSNIKHSSIDEINDYGIHKQNYITIKLSKNHLCLLKFILWLQIIITLVSFVLCIVSPFRANDRLAMSRSSYWYYFLYSIVICLSICQAFGAISKKHNNNDAFTCFVILLIILAIIEIIIISKYFFVAFPPTDIYENWSIEPIVLYLISLLRLILYVTIICVIISYMASYYDKWDVRRGNASRFDAIP